MLHPSYTDLMKIVNEGSEGDTPVVNSRYSIVMATAKRAREIISDEDADPDDRAKPLTAAVRELNEGILKILPDNAPEDETVPSEGHILHLADGTSSELSGSDEDALEYSDEEDTEYSDEDSEYSDEEMEYADDDEADDEIDEDENE